MTTRNLAVALLAIAVLGTLYVLVKPQTTEPDVPVAASAPPAAASVPAAAPRRIALSADAPGELALTATLGERLVLEVQAAKPGHLSVHGLSDADHAVGPPGPARVSIDAAAAGVFPIHYHGPQGEHVPLGVLEVTPR